MVETSILAALTAQTGSPPNLVYVTSAENRVYALVLPAKLAKPAISFQRISSDPITSIAGSTSGIDRVRMQVDSWAKTYEAAKQLAGEARAVMQGATFQGVLSDERDDFDEQAKMFRVSSDYYCWQRD